MAPADPQRFAAVYDAHLGHVLAYARRRLASPEEAEEVAAETFIVAWRRLADVPDEPLPWLYGVARNTILNVRRGERRRRELLRALEDDGLRAGSLAGDLPPGATHDDVPLAHALDALDADEREALLLTAWEGLTARQAARAMGVSRSTMTRRLAAARRHLRGALDGADAAAARRDDVTTTSQDGGPR